jgi:hypothetical protein
MAAVIRYNIEFVCKKKKQAGMRKGKTGKNSGFQALVSGILPGNILVV